MGTVSASFGLENAVLDGIDAWELYLACPWEEASILSFSADKELRPKACGTSLDHWLDLSA
jgi:hypothetical protein